MTVRRNALALLAFAALLLAAGCGGGDTTPTTAETDEPLYQQGVRLKKQGSPQEAFVSFLKVIEKRGERAAPESHLEVGLIYFTNFKDYIEAIHHFQKYLELKPNSTEAQRVRDLVNTAKREFLRSMPARPPDDYAVRPQDTMEIEELRRQNAELRAQLATLQGGAATPVIRSSRSLLPVDPPRSAPAPAPADDSPFSVAPPTRNAAVQAAPPPVFTPAPLPQRAAQATTQRATQPTTQRVAQPTATPTRPGQPANTGRRYRVGAGEGLWAIARKFEPVNTGKKVREIADANPEIFPGGNINAPLKQGMELRIP